MEPLTQRLALRYHMPGLSPKDTGEYVRHQMALAGAPDPIFADDALAAIHEFSFGIPRRIGAIAEQALTYAMFDDKRSVDANIVLRVKASAG